METREFYDERSPEVPSGLFDLTRWPARMRDGLVALANRRIVEIDSVTSHMLLDSSGFARIPEPESGPNSRWAAVIVEAHRAMEIAVGSHIPAMVRLERVYRLQFASFGPRDWKMLSRLFEQLPGWKGARPYPHWFGKEGDTPPCLWGKIEQDGLRVCGELQRGRWAGWDTWLRRNLHEFPLQ